MAVRRLPLTWSSPPESIVIKIPATQKRTTASWVGFVTASRNVLQAPLPVSARGENLYLFAHLPCWGSTGQRVS